MRHFCWRRVYQSGGGICPGSDRYAIIILRVRGVGLLIISGFIKKLLATKEGFFVMHHVFALHLRDVAFVILACLLFFIVVGSVALAQEGGAVSETALSARIGELEALERKTDAQKQEMSQLLQARLFAQKTRESLARATQFRNDADAAPARLRKLNAALAKPLDDESPRLSATGTLEKFSHELDEARANLEAERRARDNVESDAAHRANRRQQIPEDAATARKRLDEIRATLAAPPDAQLATEVVAARRTALQMEQVYLQQWLAELDSELIAYDALKDVLRARRQLAERRVIQAGRVVAVLEERVEGLRVEQAEEAQRSAERALREAGEAHPVLQLIADQNSRLAAERAVVIDKTRIASEEKQRIGELETFWSKSFAEMKGKVSRAGLTEAVGLRLRSQLLQLPDEKTHQGHLGARRGEIDQVQLRRVDLEDSLIALVDLKREVSKRLSEAKVVIADEERAELGKAVEQALLKQGSEYLTPLVRAYDSYFDTVLLPLQDRERTLVDVVSAYRAFIAERVFWVKSTRAIDLETAAALWPATLWLLDPVHWERTMIGVGRGLVGNPLPWLITLLAFGGLLGFRSKMRRMLMSYGRQAPKLHKATLAETFYSLALTVAIAGVWPVLFWGIAQSLGMSAGGEFANAVSTGLKRVAVLMYALEFLRVLCRPGGVGEAHFRWPVSNLKLIRRHLSWFMPVVLSLAFVIAATSTQPIEAYRDSLGRLAFIAAMIALIVLMWFILHPRHGIMRQMVMRRAEGWFDRLRYVWFSAILALPLGFAVAAVVGYFYTALQLEQRVVISVEFILGVFIVHAILLRWLNITQRKLAIEQLRKKYAAAQAEAAAAGEGQGTPVNPEVELADEHFDLEAVSGQTLKLLRSIAVFTVAVGLYWIWREVLPALNIFQSVELWNVTESVADPSAEGAATQRVVPITLANFAEALIIVLVTTIVSKNIPGLMEMAVLQRLPITPSGRYAITSIVRYVIVIIGIVVAFGAIGISWSSVQFLAAAITVGLGFGLQEIFANFVSGLIILFERQIRVGDVVTVGATSGRVSKIHMRATTITDWNRKELIIPNKEFVTGQVINWSLSDPVLRLDIPIGIAYGSDTELATRILLDIVNQHPNVMKDPPPRALFTGFGDSCLNFMLWAYIYYENMVTVRDELLRSVDNAFREANIEIAYVQRDIHIRSLPKGISLNLSEHEAPDSGRL